MAVTGDREHSCILSSVDYGLTWKVALSHEDLNITEHELYNSYYSKSRDLFLIPVGEIILLIQHQMESILVKENMICL